ncbi:HNH endonuclease signature motif containing protein [Paraburkholderia sp. BL9I2N2]|uniref:HNH endonuclease signature motif containing protein n=1 Tax=Paraburkholderia sp. BL9I2N2 TaxID=1938809 RepID=UPI0014047F9E|nr:HNH endonuclease signature motif containing protein [Paraburkholderia sp. BL9I2N2]
MTAYRASYIMHKGEIPSGYVVRHKCDDPACVNPEHLELGTQKDNCADKVLRNRCNAKAGSAHSNTSLTEKDVLDMRASADSMKTLAAHYGVHYMTVYDIMKRRTWKHI